MPDSALPGLPADPFHYALSWASEGQGVVMATVVGTSGSAPRPPGSTMVIGSGGRIEGSVSGGCVEGAVITVARDILAGAPPALLHYGGSDAGEWAVRLACGGTLTVFVEAIRTASYPLGTFSVELLKQVISGMGQRNAVTLIRALDGCSHAVVTGAQTEPQSDCVPLALMSKADELAEGECLQQDDANGQSWFLQSIPPPLRLIVTGAVHIAQTLTTMASAIGFETIIVDPRSSLATPERFRDASLITDWPDEALAALAIDSRTAVVTLTHDSKLDDPALSVAVQSPAFYIGALGSRRTHAARLKRLKNEGLAEHLLKKIRGPVGLPIGAIGAPEIAVSILADIIAVRRGSPLAVREEDWWSSVGGSGSSDASCSVGSGRDSL
ncbi:XdhC family protein [Acetobacter fallax]